MILLLVSATTSAAQVTVLLREPFNNAAQFVATQDGGAPAPFFSDSSSDYFGINNGAGASAFSGTTGIGTDNPPSGAPSYTGFIGSYFEAEDLDGEGYSIPLTLTWNAVQGTCQGTLVFSGMFAEDGSRSIDALDYMKVRVAVDGAAPATILSFHGNGDRFNEAFAEDTDGDGLGDGIILSSAARIFTKAIPGVLQSNFVLSIELMLNAGNEEIAFDNFAVACGPLIISPPMPPPAPPQGPPPPPPSPSPPPPDPNAASPPPPAPSPPPPVYSPGPPAAAGSMWAVITGGAYCQIVADAAGNAGRCVTDGAGVHSANEACVVVTTTSIFATATAFNTETNYDYVTLAGTVYTGTNGPANVAMAAGASLTWNSDGSVHRDGFTICASTTSVAVSPPPPPPPSPSPPLYSPAPPTPAGDLFAIITGSAHCQTTANAAGTAGACVTDGTGNYAAGELCIFRAQQPMRISSTEFNTETYFDHIMIGNSRLSGTTGVNNVALAEGATFRWSSECASPHDPTRR